MSYHTINEEAARRANDMNSFRDYKAGSATAEYRRMVDAATELAERQKQRVDPMYHEKIDRLLETYCRKLAENMNASYSIEARCPLHPDLRRRQLPGPQEREAERGQRPQPGRVELHPGFA